MQSYFASPLFLSCLIERDKSKGRCPPGCEFSDVHIITNPSRRRMSGFFIGTGFA